MAYLAITQSSAEWLQTRRDVIARLGSDLQGDQLAGTKTSDFVAGPMRMRQSSDGALLALWNIDYVTNTGQEPWGLIALNARIGLRAQPAHFHEELERSLYIVVQRLQKLRLEGMVSRLWVAENVQTCSVGRRSTTQLTLAYIEAEINAVNALLIVGPVASEFQVELVKIAANERRKLRTLVGAANSIMNPRTPRPLMGADTLVELRGLLVPTATPRDMLHAQSISLPYVEGHQPYFTYSLNYADWTAPLSPLGEVQRRVLDSNVIKSGPLRLRGPAGSGKTLVMQLLAAKQLLEDAGEHPKILYVTHNVAMSHTVMNRFAILGLEDQLTNGQLDVSTLADYGRAQLELRAESVINIDAEKSKEFQLDAVKRALRSQLQRGGGSWLRSSNLMQQVQRSENLFNVFARLIVAEISVAIKGWSREGNEEHYVESEKSLSRLHGIMSHDERAFVFSVFRSYHLDVFEKEQVLDTDDLAITLYSKLRTPLWQLKRRDEGYDYVFVDEAQLFNENEKRVFHLLTRGVRTYVPIAIALDQAQDLMGGQSATLGTFEIKDFNTTTQDLRSSHRCAPAIRRLAYFTISQTTDLFSSDYPDFTADTFDGVVEDRNLMKRPVLWNIGLERFAADLLEKISGLRRLGMVRVAIVILSDDYSQLATQLTREDASVRQLEERGQLISDAAIVVSRPGYIGGQEFDAVVAVGLEEGVVPQEIPGADTFNYAVSQQAYREMYLTFTRARYQLYVVVRGKRHVTDVIKEARKADLISYE